MAVFEKVEMLSRRRRRLQGTGFRLQHTSPDA
jgi:hypothetical protein